jgi:hypothetical protein
LWGIDMDQNPPQFFSVALRTLYEERPFITVSYVIEATEDLQTKILPFDALNNENGMQTPN